MLAVAVQKEKPLGEGDGGPPFFFFSNRCASVAWV